MTSLTDHEKAKVRLQIRGIENTVQYLRFHRDQIKNHIINAIPQQSSRLIIPEKEINIDYGNIPPEFIKAIKDAKLHLKIYQFYNLEFQMDIVCSRWLGHLISDLYNMLNYIFNLIVLAHPRLSGVTLSDELKSLIKNQSCLFGKLSSVMMQNKAWIEDFKDKRRIEEHKSPMEFHMRFEIRNPDAKAYFLLKNDYTAASVDLIYVLNLF